MRVRVCAWYVSRPSSSMSLAGADNRTPKQKEALHDECRASVRSLAAGPQDQVLVAEYQGSCATINFAMALCGLLCFLSGSVHFALDICWRRIALVSVFLVRQSLSAVFGLFPKVRRYYRPLVIGRVIRALMAATSREMVCLICCTCGWMDWPWRAFCKPCWMSLARS